MNFSDFNLAPGIVEGIESMGFQKATPVQEEAIPAILSGRDVIACAQTGTGKTAAYLLPVMSKITQQQKGKINTIVIAPTRELAVQIEQQAQGFGYFANVSSMAIYGGKDGSSFDSEKGALKKGADLIVGTPGRLLTHLNLGYVDVDSLKHLVLDEADRMLDMGFFEDIMKIVNFMPKENRQTLLFSATMPPKIRTLANKILQNPTQVSVAISKPAEGIHQSAYVVYDNQKNDLAAHILNDDTLHGVIVFSSTKSNVKALASTLKKAGLSAEAIHSDLEQSEREIVLQKFKNKQIKTLVATDILSRGIDIEDLSMVLNYDVPSDVEDYIHRIGRTARAASKGKAVTFINKDDQYKFQRIEKHLGREVEKNPLPETLGKGPEYNPSASSERRHSGGNHRGGRDRGGSGRKPFRGNNKRR